MSLSLDNKLFLQRLCAGISFIVIVLFVVQANRPSPHVDQKEGIDLYATFESADGIEVNSVVRLAGIEVGWVSEMKFSDPTRRTVLVKLRINHEEIVNNTTPVPDDSVIRIISPGLVADKELLIEVGGSFTYLKDGDEFLYAQESFVLDDIIRFLISSNNSE